jgi:hypothetical protein
MQVFVLAVADLQVEPPAEEAGVLDLVPHRGRGTALPVHPDGEPRKAPRLHDLLSVLGLHPGEQLPGDF